jgi:adenylate kinase family enzyme
MNSGSEHSEIISNSIKEGNIVPAIVTVGLLEKAISKSSKCNILIDGFPRNDESNKEWEKEVFRVIVANISSAWRKSSFTFCALFRML